MPKTTLNSSDASDLAAFLDLYRAEFEIEIADMYDDVSDETAGEIAGRIIQTLHAIANGR